MDRYPGGPLSRETYILMFNCNAPFQLGKISCACLHTSPSCDLIAVYPFTYLLHHKFYTFVMGVLKMENIVPRGTGIEPTSLAFRASVLTITSHMLPDVPILPTPTCLCDSFPEKSVYTHSIVPPFLDSLTGCGRRIGRARALCARDRGFGSWLCQTNDLQK